MPVIKCEGHFATWSEFVLLENSNTWATSIRALQNTGLKSVYTNSRRYGQWQQTIAETHTVQMESTLLRKTPPPNNISGSGARKTLTSSGESYYCVVCDIVLGDMGPVFIDGTLTRDRFVQLVPAICSRHGCCCEHLVHARRGRTT